LHWLDWVDAAARFLEKIALGIARLAQAQHGGIADYILLFESRSGHAKMPGDVQQIGLGDVDEALGIATARATGLAFET
jgi:hypothetical protein